jgi:hypothetical protein
MLLVTEQPLPGGSGHASANACPQHGSGERGSRRGGTVVTEPLRLRTLSLSPSVAGPSII